MKKRADATPTTVSHETDTGLMLNGSVPGGSGGVAAAQAASAHSPSDGISGTVGFIDRATSA